MIYNKFTDKTLKTTLKHTKTRKPVWFETGFPIKKASDRPKGHAAPIKK